MSVPEGPKPQKKNPLLAKWDSFLEQRREARCVEQNITQLFLSVARRGRNVMEPLKGVNNVNTSLNALFTSISSFIRSHPGDTLADAINQKRVVFAQFSTDLRALKDQYIEVQLQVNDVSYMEFATSKKDVLKSKLLPYTEIATLADKFLGPVYELREEFKRVYGTGREDIGRFADDYVLPDDITRDLSALLADIDALLVAVHAPKES